MKWKDKLEEWENGIPQTYPERIHDGFFYETYKCDNKMENTYKQKFIPSKKLNFKQDTTQYKEYLEKTSNKYVTSFWNLSKDSLLVIPIQRRGKDFGTIKTFTDNATEIQKKHFWREVARLAKQMLKTHKQIYINTHGLGVSYFHLRLDTMPKYYKTKEFI